VYKRCRCRDFAYLSSDMFDLTSRGVATGYIGIYTPPPKSVYLKCFMWLFCLLDPFIPTQIKFMATPLSRQRLYAQLWSFLQHDIPHLVTGLFASWQPGSGTLTVKRRHHWQHLPHHLDTKTENFPVLSVLLLSASDNVDYTSFQTTVLVVMLLFSSFTSQF